MNYSISPRQIHMDLWDQYKNNNAAKLIDLYITGSGSQLKGHVLLPQNASSVAAVTAGNKSPPYKIVIVENYKQVNFKLPLPAVQRVAIRYRLLNDPIGMIRIFRLSGPIIPAKNLILHPLIYLNDLHATTPEMYLYNFILF